MGVCAGIADYTGLRRHSGPDHVRRRRVHERRRVLPLYFIAGFIADDKPRELALEDREEQRFWQGVRASPAPHRARHPQPLPRHRPAAGRHRKLCDDRKPQPRPRNRAAALSSYQGETSMNSADRASSLRSSPSSCWRGSSPPAIRAKHGYPLEDEWGGTRRPRRAADDDDQGAGRRKRAAEARRVGRLEERLKVLERIATDPIDASCADEIDNLR